MIYHTEFRTYTYANIYIHTYFYDAYLPVIFNSNAIILKQKHRDRQRKKENRYFRVEAIIDI